MKNKQIRDLFLQFKLKVVCHVRQPQYEHNNLPAYWHKSSFCFANSVDDTQFSVNIIPLACSLDYLSFSVSAVHLPKFPTILSSEN